MKPNFHAIDAIAYALRSGITKLPVFVRRGWLGVAVFVAAILVFAGTMMEAAETFEDLDAGEIVYEFSAQMDAFFSGEPYERDYDPFEGLDDEEEQFLGAFFLAMFGQFLGLILMVPGFVDLYRAAAGRTPPAGWLPGFGRAEWSLIVAVILSFLALVAFMMVAAIPAAGLAYLAYLIEFPVALVLVVLAFAVAVIWFQIRIALVPAHAALREEVAFGDGFALTRGRFWKLLGTLILFAVIMWLISTLFSFLGMAGDFMLAFGASFAVNTLVSIYYYVAATGLYGRIAADLMGLDPDGEEGVGADDDADEDLVEDGTFDLDADAASEDRRPRGEARYGQPMRRSDPAYVPRRLR